MYADIRTSIIYCYLDYSTNKSQVRVVLRHPLWPNFPTKIHGITCSLVLIVVLISSASYIVPLSFARLWSWPLSTLFRRWEDMKAEAEGRLPVLMSTQASLRKQYSDAERQCKRAKVCLSRPGSWYDTYSFASTVGPRKGSEESSWQVGTRDCETSARSYYWSPCQYWLPGRIKSGRLKPMSRHLPYMIITLSESYRREGVDYKAIRQRGWAKNRVGQRQCATCQKAWRLGSTSC